MAVDHNAYLSQAIVFVNPSLKCVGTFNPNSCHTFAGLCLDSSILDSPKTPPEGSS
jgi:hypothetical protein